MKAIEVALYLVHNGIKKEQIVLAQGGFQVTVKTECESNIYDPAKYQRAFNKFMDMFEGKLDPKRVHFIDHQTFTIECPDWQELANIQAKNQEK